MEPLRTERLTLVALTPELARTALDDMLEFGRMLGARVPKTWPGADFARMLPRLAEGFERESSEPTRLIVHSAEATLVGETGFHGPPDGTGTVEVGYSIVPAYRGMGFATEATRALIQHALVRPEVRRIVAECHEDNAPSLRVLEKLRMRRTGSAGDTLRFEIRRAEEEPAGETMLRDVAEGDLPVFFDQQLDPEANRMAAFTAENPADRDAFTARWKRILGDETIAKKTVLFDGKVAGHVLSFEQFGEREVSYWIGKEHWGKGLTTRALSEFLAQVTTRPLYARTARDNVASIRVLEKCGFEICGEDRGFSNARGEEVEEFILKLETDQRDKASRSLAPSGLH